MPQETFGQRLVRLRQWRGLTQREMAQRAEMRQSLISMIEHDDRDGLKMQLGAALRLARVLGITVEYLATGQQPARASRKSPAHLS